jgi:hypothetical protein
VTQTDNGTSCKNGRQRATSFAEAWGVVVVLVAHLHFGSSPVWPLVADDNVPGDMLCIGMAAFPVARLTGHNLADLLTFHGMYK